MNLASTAVPRTMAQGNAPSPKPLCKIQRYGLAVLSVAVALGGALLLDHLRFPGLVSPFMLALAVAAWYGGTGAAMLALLLSCISFAYFFLRPFHTLFGAFASFALLVTWFCIVRRGVQALRRSEAYLAEAQKLSHTGSFGWDVSSGKIYWSQETFRIFAYDPPIEPTLKLVLQRTHPEDRTKVEKVIDRVSEERKDFDFEHRLLMPDGSVKYLRVVGRPSNDASGHFEFVGAVTDITERKRAEEQLRQKEVSLREVQTELAHVNRLTTMGELAASIAHEVNQPLAAVVNNASACVRWLTAHNLEEARRSASLIVAEGHRAGEIISRIRALAKKAPPQKDWLDLNETIGEVITMVRSEVLRNRISLQTQLANDLPPILGDKIQLQQVILNLLINAVEAMRAVSEGPLWVSSEKITEIPAREPRALQTGESEEDVLADKALVEAEGTHVLITVRDSGPGLDPEGFHRLFDAFYTTKPQGLGMGLAISRSIIEAHGGRLWAQANAPRGALFQFTLPIRHGASLPSLRNSLP